MTWPATILSAILSAAASALLGGYIANLAVGWHRIPSREGGSGFFVLFMGLFALVGGLVIGIVCARLVNPGPTAFVKGFGLSLGVIALVIGVVGTISRRVAHVPPTLDGDPLLVALEVRFPESQTQSPALDPGQPSLAFNALIGGQFVPEMETGMLRTEYARQEGGRWVVPGEFPLSTERGKRIVSVALPGKKEESFQIPLPRRPGRKFLEWSEWLPYPRRDGQPPVNSLTYRFRVQPESTPLYWEKFGPFELGIVSGRCRRFRIDETFQHTVSDHFRIRHGGKDLAFDVIEEDGTKVATKSEISQITILKSAQPAFLASINASYRSSVYLVTEKEGRLHIERLNTQGEKVREIAPASGRPLRGPMPRKDENRLAPADDGLLYIGNFTVFDPRSLTHRRFSSPKEWHSPEDLLPIAYSPDRTQIVRCGITTSEGNREVLVGIDLVSNTAYALPLDPRRMRYVTRQRIDGAWIAHHFEWARGEHGRDRLVERAQFKPLPHAGEFKKEYDGYRSYQVHYGTEALRAEFGRFLEREFKAERQPSGASEYSQSFKIGGQLVSVAYSAGEHGVSVFMERGADTRVMDEIARRFDQELATGRLDAMIER